MLNGDVEHLHQLGMAFFRALEGVFDGVIEFLPDALVVTLDFLVRRPILWIVGWQTAADGIDSERKKLIEDAMEGAQTKSALRKQVPVKGFYVTDIKNEAVTLGDGPVIESFFADELEKLVRARTRV
jgi:hypothetical protein